MLVGLHAELPLRMGKAVGDDEPGILGDVRTIHRLQREAPEIETDERLGPNIDLRIDELQLVALPHLQLIWSLGADADPVYAGGQFDRAIGLEGNLEATRMQRLNQGAI